MNYAAIKNCDIANGCGVRVSVFVSGCRNYCRDCFNSVAWDFSYGEPFTDEVKGVILEMCRPSYISGLSILGGEPFEPENQMCILALIHEFRNVFRNTKNIWLYSGFTFEELTSMEDVRCSIGETTNDILRQIDILVDGRFEIEKHDVSLAFRGSKNQRIIDVQESLKQKTICLWRGGDY